MWQEPSSNSSKRRSRILPTAKPQQQQQQNAPQQQRSSTPAASDSISRLRFVKSSLPLVAAPSPLRNEAQEEEEEEEVEVEEEEEEAEEEGMDDGDADADADDDDDSATESESDGTAINNKLSSSVATVSTNSAPILAKPAHKRPDPMPGLPADNGVPPPEESRINSYGRAPVLKEEPSVTIDPTKSHSLMDESAGNNRKAMLKELASRYKSECVATCQRILILQKQWKQELEDCVPTTVECKAPSGFQATIQKDTSPSKGESKRKSAVALESQDRPSKSHAKRPAG